MGAIGGHRERASATRAETSSRQRTFTRVQYRQLALLRMRSCETSKPLPQNRPIACLRLMPKKAAANAGIKRIDALLGTHEAAEQATRHARRRGTRRGSCACGGFIRPPLYYYMARRGTLASAPNFTRGRAAPPPPAPTVGVGGSLGPGRDVAIPKWPYRFSLPASALARCSIHQRGRRLEAWTRAHTFTCPSRSAASVSSRSEGWTRWLSLSIRDVPTRVTYADF